MERQVARQIVEFKCKTMEEELKKLGFKVNHHERNIKFLKSELNAVEEACVDLGIKLGNYHSSVAAVANNDTSAQEGEQLTIQSILDHDKTAAGIMCQLKVRHYLLASKMPLMKDILGFVATLGKVNDDNLSRILSEYLGMDNMLALVCKTYDSVKGLEKYDKNGFIDKSSGLHGLARTIGKVLDGRFTVFCLENLRPFSDVVNTDDPQRKLILQRPSKNLEVKFAVSRGVSSLPEDITDMEEQVKLKNWEKERLLEDMKREEDLLNQVKELYSKQKHELMGYLTQPAITQMAHGSPTVRSPATPGSNPFGAKPSHMQ
ncbi:hypothetical protein QOZ80_1AG0000490 [Eleusine coracana subsp. coracana]|nr:hypothetical protein QOZ80_1AG0000490 [Eleusine coracana subsp. coracana]